MKSKRAPFILVGLLGVVMGLSGCGGDESKPAATATLSPPPTVTQAPAIPTAAQVELEEGWKDYDRSKDGFSIALPPRWQQLDMDPATFKATLEELKASNPQLAQVLSSQVTNMVSSNVKFFAFDKNADVSSGSFATNLNVIVTDVLASVTLDVFGDTIIKQLPQQLGNMLVGEITHERVTLGSGEAEKINYTLSLNQAGQTTPTRAATTQYLALGGGKAHILTFSTLEDAQDQYADTFTKIAKTFRTMK